MESYCKSMKGSLLPIMNIVNKSLTTSSLSSLNYDFQKSKVQFINSPQHFHGQDSLDCQDAFSQINIYQFGLLDASPVLIISFISWEFSVASESKCWKEKVNTISYSVNLAFHSSQMHFISSHFCEPFKKRRGREDRGTSCALKEADKRPSPQAGS